MSFPIAPIAALGGIGAAAPVMPTTAAAGANPTSATNFAQALGDGLDQVQATQGTADNLAIQAATGQLTDPATYTIAATQAQLMTQLMTTLESKGVDAFNQIMSMQA
ncbi:MAG TPA: flagellar hook-basal body complex protein FliE [Jatrophihabitans sp.]|jgi:flagellar hook-basal body complex protein FliE